MLMPATKTVLELNRQSLLEPESDGDMENKSKMIMGRKDFSDLYIK